MANSAKNAHTANGLAKRLRMFRLERDLSYKALAAVIGGVHHDTVRRFIAGQHHPSERTEHKIREFLKGVV